MEANTTARDVFWRVLFGFLYGFILIVLSFIAAGGPEGGGAGLPLVISSAPLGAGGEIGLVFYGTPFLWALLAYSTTMVFRWIPQFLFLLHYISAVLILIFLPVGWLGGGGAWIIVWAPVYLGGQVMFWRAIGRIGRVD
jgi:hypothetical protein